MFGDVLKRVSTAIDVSLGLVGLLLVVAFVVWSKRKEDELLERAAREVPGSVAQLLGEDEPTA